jgi:hypothetical protein
MDRWGEIGRCAGAFAMLTSPVLNGHAAGGNPRNIRSLLSEYYPGCGPNFAARLTSTSRDANMNREKLLRNHIFA